MAARSTFQISDDVRDVLSRSTITETTVSLPKQLDRALYQQVDKALKGAGGAWNRSKGVHVFERDPREALGLAVETGKAINIRTKLQAFYTPEPLADRVAVAVGTLPDGARVLEPSIGEGALIVALAKRFPSIVVDAFEIDSVAAAKAVGVLEGCLEARDGTRYMVVVQDFLTVAPRAVYDAVVMNSPFTKGADMAHVTHAWKFVKPGGVLVALMAPSFQHTNTKPARAFRALLTTTLAYEIADIPAGTFEHTNVETRMVVMRKST